MSLSYSDPLPSNRVSMEIYINYSQLYRKFSFLESLVDKEFIFLAADSIDTLVETSVLTIVFTLHSNVV